MSLIRLDWDSEFFKLNIGSIRIKDFSKDFDCALNQIKQSSFDLTFLHSKSFPTKFLNTKHFQETKLTFKKKVSAHQKINTKVFSYVGEVNKELIDLTFEAGINSRYKLDPKLSPFFEEFYKKWLENSLNRTFADDVLIVKNKQGFLGFITLRKEDESSTSIGLMAVNKDFKRIGIGSALIKAAENWVFSNNLQYLKVVTQKSNKNACLFYKNMGFNLFDIDYTFHIWKK